GPACPLTLTFPPQPGLDANALKAGNYRRDLPPGGTATLTAEDLPIVTPAGDAPGRFYVGADGLPPAFLFTPRWALTRREAITLTSAAPLGRIYPGAALGARPARLAALPSEKSPVRIEVDSPPAGASLRVGLDRDGNGVIDENSDEVMIKPGAYE